ncbi:MAG TPA: HlyD family efflux transporter periplasmic adaptor subunit [Bacteroidales bacterium]|nr:HlyD family efflux transporter periplasmic adaptor subunit [Bacteroidales bacterium]
MKKYVFIISMALLTACSGKKDKADAYGNFEADEIIISSEVSGRIMQLNLEEGQELKEGALVGIIDTTDYQLKKEQLTAQKNAISSRSGNIASQIEVQQQQKNNLLVDKARIEKLYKDGAATKKQLDDINGSISLVDKQIQSIKTQNGSVADEILAVIKQIDQVSQNIRKCHLVCPVSGTVLGKYIEANELVVPGKTLYKIADLENIFLRAYVSESQLANVKTGQKVQVLIDKGNETMATYEGTVTWISSAAEFTPKIIQTKEERVNLVYAIKIKVKNDGAIKIGMPGEVRFSGK